jgi:hypothetical protein
LETPLLNTWGGGGCSSLEGEIKSIKMAHKAIAKNGESVRRASSVQIKREITEMHERGVNIIALISEYGLPHSPFPRLCTLYALFMLYLSMFLLILMVLYDIITLMY